MNFLDVVLLAVLVGAAVGGYRLGFVSRVFSWVGLALGLLIAARVLPWMLDRVGDSAGRGATLLLASTVFVAGAFAGQALGMLVGRRARLAVPPGPARTADSVVGTVGGVVGVLVLVWLLLPAVAEIQGAPARVVRGSTIARAVTDALPAPPDATQALRRLLGDDFPQVFDGIQPAPDVGPPPLASGLSQATADTVAESIVKVVGEACGRIQEGTGFAVGGGLVVTNAHVVAGEPDTFVDTRAGDRLPAQVMAFDPGADLAVLVVDGFSPPALALGDAGEDTSGGVFGHPGGGDLVISPFRVGARVTATGSDIYGTSRSERDVLVLAADLAPGDSGAPLVDPTGTVVGVAFAIAPDEPGVAYALHPDHVRTILEAVGTAPVDAGACVA